MNEMQVFGMALGLEGTPGRVTDIRFDPVARRLDIDLDFPPAAIWLIRTPVRSAQSTAPSSAPGGT